MGSSFRAAEPTPWPGDVAEAETAPWYILRAATRQEKRACESLTELRIEHYMPCETVLRKLCRQEVPHKRALFPGYLFAQIPDAMFHVAIEADGVHAPVRTYTASGERVPRTVPAGLVMELKEAEDRGDFDKSKVTPLAAGDRLRIVGGPFEGRMGDLLKLKSGDRIQLLLEGYGKTTIDALMVERVA